MANNLQNMVDPEADQIWPATGVNKLADKMLLQVPRDSAARTLPPFLPGPSVDENGNPLDEHDPLRAQQFLASGIPIVVDDVVASALMVHNTMNRKQSKSNLGRLTKVILRGEWRFNGASAILPCSLTSILDRQHTLQAVINAFEIGRAANIKVKPVVLIPVIGLHPETFNTIDHGRPRTVQDTLTAYENVGILDLADIRENVWSMAIRVLLQYINLTQDIPEDSPLYMENIRDKVPNHHVGVVFKMFPDLRDSLLYCVKIGVQQKNELVPLAVAGVLHNIISEVQSPTAANNFVRSLATGVNLTDESPIRQLREQLIRDRNSARPIRIEGINMLAMCVRTWNAVATHKTATTRRIADFNSDNTFPAPQPMSRRVAR